MIQGMHRLKISKYSIYFIFTVVLLFDSGVLNGFGLRGPYSHEKINQEAFKIFAKNTGFEVRVDCAELINQTNYQADVHLPLKPEYHCDNSEFFKCSRELDILKNRSFKDPNFITSMRQIGLSTHIVQDFYAHSNWVEITRNSYVIAPLENLKDSYVAIPNLQSGYHPFSPEGGVMDMVGCFLFPEAEWGLHILGATHGCMEKDSNYSLRGATIADSPLGFGRTYHEIAGELAIDHTVKLLQYFYDRKHPHLMSCLVPSFQGIGCNQYFYGRLRGSGKAKIKL